MESLLTTPWAAIWAGETELFFVWQLSSPRLQIEPSSLLPSGRRHPQSRTVSTLSHRRHPDTNLAGLHPIPPHNFHNVSIPHDASGKNGVEVHADDSDSDARVRGRWVQPVILVFLNKETESRALYDLRLVNKASGLSSSVRSCLKSPRVFSHLDGLNQSVALLVEEIAEVQMPPSNLSSNLGNLLTTGEEADVTFQVEGEDFSAHKFVLAMRSPVFKAELYGPMKGKTTRKITVQDMQPAVFSVLLHFVYTDELPSMEDLDDDDEKKEMVKHLLVAADRYALERLKMICEGVLCKSLDVESVATMLALADQHQCSRLRDACVLFLKSSDRMDDMVASPGYVHLKESSPAVLVDILERLALSHKI